VSLTVIQLDSVELVSGATNQNVIPPNTWVAVKNTNATPEYVVVEAVLDPDIDETALPDGFVTWTGGTPWTGIPYNGKSANKHLCIRK